MGLIENILARAGYYKAGMLRKPIQPQFREEARADKWNMPDYTQFGNQASLYAKLSWINTAVSVLARTAASTQLNVLKYTQERERDIISHPFEDLLRRPNPLHSRREFLEISFSNYLLTGNCYWWLNIVNSSVKEMWVRRSDELLPVPDEQSYLEGYAFRAPGMAEPIPLSVEEVAHFKTYNPFNAFVGLSLVESIAMAAEGDMAMQKQNVRTYKDEGGKLPSVLAFADPINEVDWQLMQRNVREQEAKRQMMLLQNVGKGGVEWIQNAISNKDMAYLESREFTKEEIWAQFAPGLASMLAVNATEANSRAGKATFLELAVYPLLCAFSEKITNDILPYYGDDLICEFEDVRMSDKQMELNEQQEYARSHTIDEIRKKYYKDSVLGDERGMLLPVQISPDTPMPGEEPEPQAQSGQPAPVQAPPDESNEEVEMGGEEQEQEQDNVEAELQKWERKAAKAVKAGKSADVRFESEVIPLSLSGAISGALEETDTPDAVKAVFDNARVWGAYP